MTRATGALLSVLVLLFASGVAEAQGRRDRPTSTLANDATPSVIGNHAWLTGGTTTLTDFDDGYDGKEITIVSEHAVTIIDGTNIFLNGSANFAMASGDTLTLIQKADGKWYEASRSINLSSANCAAGEIPLGVDAVGATEECYEPAFTDITGSATDAQTPDAHTINPATSAAADPADVGVIRLGNAELICWEASPAGTDACMSVDSAETFNITGAPLIAIRSGSKASAGEQVRFNFGTDEANPLELAMRVMGDAVAGNRFTEIQSIEQGVSVRTLKLNPSGGNVETGGDLILKSGTTSTDGAIAYDRTNEDLSVGDGSVSQIVHMGEWKTWTPVFTGFSSDPPVNSARYTQIGKLVIARVNMSNGTSNATTFTITLPISADGDVKQFFTLPVVTDNGVASTTPGLLKTRAGLTIADVYRDSANLAWTASGSKKVQFTIAYESN